jgi:hypothetical protein
LGEVTATLPLTLLIPGFLRVLMLMEASYYRRAFETMLFRNKDLEEEAYPPRNLGRTTPNECVVS